MRIIALLIFLFCLPCANSGRRLHVEIAVVPSRPRHRHPEQIDKSKSSAAWILLQANDHERRLSSSRTLAMSVPALGAQRSKLRQLVSFPWKLAGARHGLHPEMLRPRRSHVVRSPTAMRQDDSSVLAGRVTSGLTRRNFVQSLAIQASVPMAASALVGGGEVSATEMHAHGLVGVTVGDAKLLKERTGFCTGTLVDAERGLVLTARHCVKNPVSPLKYVVLSTDLFAEDAVRRPIVDMRVNGDYEGDLAILRFEGEIPSDYRPVTLITALKSTYSTEDSLTLYGFGQQGDDKVPALGPPGILKKLPGKLTMAVDGSEPIITTQPLDEDQGQCFGDSGGPAFVPVCLESTFGAMLRDAIGQPKATGLAQIGVLSFGGIGECSGSSEDYVNLADYGDWIEDAVKELGGKLQRAL